MSYQTYIPDEWREEQRREQEAAAEAEAMHLTAKQQCTARWKNALCSAGKVLGWVAVSVMALLVVVAGFLIVTGGRRR
jgi:hypothetical protein